MARPPSETVPSAAAAEGGSRLAVAAAAVLAGLDQTAAAAAGASILRGLTVEVVAVADPVATAALTYHESGVGVAAQPHDPRFGRLPGAWLWPSRSCFRSAE